MESDKSGERPARSAAAGGAESIDRPRGRGLEIVLVVLVSMVVLVPGIWKYSLVDPWETHYGEVSRNMLKDNDLVHMQWPGANPENSLNEGFKSKPVLTFWLTSAGMAAMGMVRHGGYSGEMVESVRTMIGIRLPIVLCAVFGLTLVWWMLARLVSRRLAWLALLVIGSCPMFCLISRQGIPDMPLCATTMGALALFILAIEDGDRPLVEHRIGRFHFDSRHIAMLFAGGFVVVQALYYLIYFIASPQLAVIGPMPHPAVWLPLLMFLLLGGLTHDGLLVLRLPFLLIGGIIAAIVNEPMPRKRPDQSWWRALVDNIFAPWDRHALDRYILRGLVFVCLWASRSGTWTDTYDLVERLLRLRRITAMRQLYLIGCYSLLGVSILAKGPPGLAVAGFVGVMYIVVANRWRALFDGDFELKRGLLLMAVTALPWHIAMFLKDGPGFINEYIYSHLLNRATDGSVDKSYGTFAYYTRELGNGMWLWAALLPAAIPSLLTNARRETREGRVRFLVGLWAIAAVGFFSLVQTKFHHYILPAVPPLAITVAFFLDDLLMKRVRLHYLYAAVAIGIVLLVCRDLVHEPKRWIEMFVFRYDRPWPAGDPWNVDPSDGFLALGGIAVAALVVAATKWARLGVFALSTAGLAICVWALQVYMPQAGTHWGMREAVRTYYEQRQIYGEHIIYSGTAQLADDWRDVGDEWSFETFIPDTLLLGQPMTLSIDVVKPEDERVKERDVQLIGTVSSIGDHTVTLKLPRGERAKLDPLIKDGLTKAKSPRWPLYLVDADRLVVWQLYWRGEQFWSGGEINGPTPDTRTTYQASTSTEILKFFNDRSRAPLGRRYFVISEGGRIPGIRNQLPTPRAKESYEILDTTSNKFSIAAFFL